MRSRVYDVPEHTWIKIAQDACSANCELKAGDTCSLLEGGSVEVIGTDGRFRTLVRYRLPKGKRAAGALCPDGALIFLDPETVTAWPPEGAVTAALARESDERKSAVDQLLSQVD